MALNNEAELPKEIADPKAERYELVKLMWKAGVSVDTIEKYTKPRKESGIGCVAISDFAGHYKEDNYEDKIEVEIHKLPAPGRCVGGVQDPSGVDAGKGRASESTS